MTQPDAAPDRPRDGSPRVAIVTGAGAGIGRAITARLRDQGATVVANDVSAERLAALDRELGVVPVVGSTADPATAAALVQAAVDAGGRVDALFNNAGISQLGDAESFPLEDWRRIIDVNLVGCFIVAQAVGRQMIAQRHGCIVNTASTSGLTAMPSNSAYIASKHGLVGLTRALAVEWARYGIRVNAIAPGLTRTETVARLEEDQPELIGGRAESSLLGRLATPDDQAAVAVFLASDAAGYVNGLIAPVDGGGVALYSGYPAPPQAGPADQ
jgi:NAD(P)-dependent dehydrogenase (short-subunit alcohol dehydrogenase family)